MARVDEIADGVFRLNTPVSADLDVSFFLIRDDQPALVGTGLRTSFDDTYAALRRLIRPSQLRYVVVPHVESDQTGALNQFLDQAPYAVALGSPIGVATNLDDLADAETRPMDDSDRLDLGTHRLRFLVTPHVHQWDSMLAYEETTGTLFAADLFISPPGDAPVTDADDTEAMVARYQQIGMFASRPHLDAALDKIEALAPRTLACHHGPVKVGHVDAYLGALRAAEITGLTRWNPMRELA